jgi:hypothetical protein
LPGPSSVTPGVVPAFGVRSGSDLCAAKYFAIESATFFTSAWSSSVTSESQRQQAAARLGLTDGQQSGAPERRTWSYLLPDGSTANIRRLVNDPLVEDTGGIDRSTLTLVEPETRRL